MNSIFQKVTTALVAKMLLASAEEQPPTPKPDETKLIKWTGPLFTEAKASSS